VTFFAAIGSTGVVPSGRDREPRTARYFRRATPLIGNDRVWPSLPPSRQTPTSAL
jgi:hypothetical protein